MNLVCDSAEVKVDIRVVFITPTSFCPYPRAVLSRIFVHAADDAVTY